MTWRTKPPKDTKCEIKDKGWVVVEREKGDHLVLKRYIYCADWCMWQCHKDRQKEIREGRR